MTYATLMVHLQLGQSNDAVLKVARDLAGRFDASIVGIAACQPMPVAYEGGYWSGEAVEQVRGELEEETKAAEAEFRGAMQGRVTWRSMITMQPLADYLAREARSADLIITGVIAPGSVFDTSRQVNVGDLVMQAGRPVLIVPLAAPPPRFDRVMIGWQDTREARRAITDALPLLQQATRVALVEIAGEDALDDARSRLTEMAAWLARHGVTATVAASPSTGHNTAQLTAMAEDQGADLIVAGAYGHSRLREWVLGGMTRQLTLHPDRCALVSH